MKHFASYITVAASSAFLFAAFFSDAINFVNRWEDNRDSIVERSVDNYTDDQTLEFDETGHEANLVELGKFYRTVK